MEFLYATLHDPWFWLAVFVFVAYTIETITGFGSIVIALSLGALLLPISLMLPVLVPLNICMTGYLAVRHRRNIHWPTLLKLILPMMAIGTLLGYGLRPWLGDAGMRSLFALLIIWFAGRELYRYWRSSDNGAQRSGWLTRTWMLLAGVTHGLFASGGPLLVYALAGIQLDKAQFRATLISVWFTLNSLLTLIFAFDGSLFASLPRLVLFLPVLVLGVLLGEWLHTRISEQRFRLAVFLLLLITGICLFIASSGAITSPE
ncbi:MAG: permease [Spongiibacteraceae bacterium]|nr:permease [Spongiibacteraceae bacterium]